ncbi:MAG: exosome complex exonuclease Rrp41 [archaeon]|jgi:exosome complex component RRP41|nr:exosome complex exonuclease Rrp41 [archaeon]MDD2477905.1 exosome complex exonuclease Rrp41 [Candidatus ainarchaeum sp.]MDD3084468.1 exosome complex exonuclease Rrp41 [Candidatus ainarchaeum sp.]MDD4220929.1 exosome complex exonuclease Rrp41 [Candidatus ainarchaeum sp.]MDD4662891.1 exosome complex exonuclease Rrp41 [Candidatus ainarchaeum sp.]
MTKRLDGRKNDELRPMKVELGVVKSADGSCYLEWGNNTVIATVHGPRPIFPKHLANSEKAVVDYRYRMAPFSVGERKSPVPAKRDKEISLVSGFSLESAIQVEKFPNTVIDIDTVILSSNAGTRAAAITAASLACADAGLPMNGIVSAVASGRANGEFILDLTKEEEDAEDAVDTAIGVLMPQKEIVLLQMDGFVKKEDWKKMISIGLKGAEKVYDFQKNALLKKYPVDGDINE